MSESHIPPVCQLQGTVKANENEPGLGSNASFFTTLECMEKVCVKIECPPVRALQYLNCTLLNSPALHLDRKHYALLSSLNSFLASGTDQSAQCFNMDATVLIQNLK